MNSVTFKGNPVNLRGKALNVGDSAPQVVLKAQDLSDITIGASGKTQIVLSVPSLDTAVCASEAREFNEKVAFCETAGIAALRVASDFVSKEFGEKYGVLMDDGALKGLLARAVFVIKDGKIAYKELVSEITEMPNIQKLSEFFGGGCGCGCGH